MVKSLPPFRYSDFIELVLGSITIVQAHCLSFCGPSSPHISYLLSSSVGSLLPKDVLFIC